MLLRWKNSGLQGKWIPEETLQEYSYPIEINALRIYPQKWDLVFRGISR